MVASVHIAGTLTLANLSLIMNRYYIVAIGASAFKNNGGGDVFPRQMVFTSYCVDVVAAACQLPRDLTCVKSTTHVSLPTSCLHNNVYVRAYERNRGDKTFIS